MSDPTHVPEPGYVLWSNYTPFGAISGKRPLPTIESVIADVLATAPQIPAEAILVKRNPIQGGYSAFVSDMYADVVADYHKGVEALLDFMRTVIDKRDGTP